MCDSYDFAQGKYADSIQSVARMGAVFFNDCAYIAHNTTLLTHMYRQVLFLLLELLL